jgi:hypothetical protein
MGFSQDGQNERGKIIDFSRGSRYIHTFRKLPTIAPNKNTIKPI